LRRGRILRKGGIGQATATLCKSQVLLCRRVCLPGGLSHIRLSGSGRGQYDGLFIEKLMPDIRPRKEALQGLVQCKASLQRGGLEARHQGWIEQQVRIGLAGQSA